MIARSRQGPQPSAPGPGDQAGSMNKLLQAVQMIQQAAMGLPPGSPLHRDALKAATNLSRHLPQGAPTAGVQMTGLKDLINQVMQSGFLQNIMQQRGGQGGGPGGAAGPAQQAPMPSMPLPGA
jgi:hypothetical protein